MSCQKVLSMLSAYIDGEVQGADAEYVAQHLAQCALCAQELEMLQRMTGVLRENAEVEPPAYLLEQIEAATVGRPGILERLRLRFGQVPQHVRWAGAAAAAVVLAVVLLSHPGMEKPAERPAARSVPESPHVVITPGSPAAEALPEVKVSVGKPKSVVIAGHRVKAAYAAGVEEDLRGELGLHPKPTSEPTRELAGEALERPEEETLSEDEAVTAGTELGTTGAAGAAVEVEPRDTGATVAGAEAGEPYISLEEDADALEELRAKLAARRRQRPDLTVERVEGKKHSVTLVGFRF